ncbi:MAG: T9SS type A sorting domain-containing protein [Bacteroidetes bacterium]|nr:T9SS type A sorting domain-containing protein [Bacteroidota bacterium]
MKRILLAAGIVGFVSNAFAQTKDVEILRPDMSYPGQSFQYKTDTSFTPPSGFLDAGKGQHWDLRNLDDNGGYTTKFLAPDASNGGDQYSDCNLVIQDDDQQPTYTHLDVSGDYVKAVDMGGDSSGIDPNFKPRMLIFPLKYGMAWSDSTNSDKTYPGSDFGAPFDSVRVKLFIQISSFVDGQGTIMLPIDSIEALRLKQDIYYKAEISGYSSTLNSWFPITTQEDDQVSYNFYNTQGGYYTARIRMKSDQPGVADVDYRSASLLSVQNPSKMETTLLYPNPAQNHVYFQTEKAGSMQIYNLQGQMVGEPVPVVSGSNEISINHLELGRYIIRIQYADGSYSTSKLIKQ